MATKIDLVSAALVLIGDTPINSLIGNSRSQQVANTLYDSIVNNELTKHRWGFARSKAQLSLTTGTPIDQEWQSIYQLPSDILFLIKLYPSVNYQIYGSKVYTNNTGKLSCDYIYAVPESNWPFYFSKMIEYALAKDFATSIRDSSASRVEMTNEYVIASRMARYTDSQQYPMTPITSNPFVNVRY
tara:strand:- start:2181 stop:2738 length:558 start_codon:yes stop_codon:yes gene_type:complete